MAHSTARQIFCLLITITWFIPCSIKAQDLRQDSIHLSIPKAEEIFLQNNLQLIASRHNIDINKGFAQQAKLWDNPVLLTDQNLYDGKFFRHRNIKGVDYGEIYLQLQQVIRTARKRGKLMQLAQDNIQTAEAAFNEEMRELKYVISTDLNNLGQLQNIVTVYGNEIRNMQLLSKGMDEMLKTGDVSEKDNTRIKALLFSLQSDYAENLHQQEDLQKELKVLLQLDPNNYIISDADTAIDPVLVKHIRLGDLQDSAASRPDLVLAKTDLLHEQHNLAYQKALVSPDITVGLEYDKLNSYVKNYYGLTIGLPLPILNRNKGNISAAQSAIERAKTMVNQAHSQVNNDIITSYKKLLNASELVNELNTGWQKKYDQLLNNMIDSYKSRQVSLIEFIDFFESWKDTRTRQLQQLTNQRNAAAELNYTTNQPIIRL
jgi:cobalt-zinc-cadmium efflux system outer membrane protein